MFKGWLEEKSDSETSLEPKKFKLIPLKIKSKI